jgi:ATP-binding protein involved in chromosome partitioning
MQDECEYYVKRIEGVKHVSVNMTSRVRSDTKPKTHQGLKQVKNLVAVASGKGGVGKSTVAVNLALALSQTGAKVGIMDTDVFGPSLPTMMGLDQEMAGDPETGMINPSEKYGLKLMSIGFFIDKTSPVIWRGPMTSQLVQKFLGEVNWGELDYLIIDMPPGTGDIQLTLTQSAPLSGAVIVTTPQEVALADVRRGVKMFERVNVPVIGVIENMSYFVCDNCSKKHYIFLQGGGRRVGQELEIPFLGEVPMDPNVADGGDRGVPVVIGRPDDRASDAYKTLAGQVAAALATMREGGDMKTMAPSPIEIIPMEDNKTGILWSDGQHHVYANRDLRAACHCASCIDEWTSKQLLDPDSIPQDIHFKSYSKVGNYGIKFNWSDGHNTGIYSYDTLRELASAQPAG